MIDILTFESTEEMVTLAREDNKDLLRIQAV
jgi:hypothetical protein